MKLLVDTHVFVWMFIEARRFSKKARAFLEDTDSNDFYLSDVSVWEASIKYGLGKLKLPARPEVFFPDRVRRSGYRHLPIDLAHVTPVHTFPRFHGDPFDRLLISQAVLEDLTIITNDPCFKRYAVKSLRIRDIS